LAQVADQRKPPIMTSPSDNSLASEASAMRLDDFIGQWRDTLGHEVHVRWARQGTRAGELDVELVKPRSNNRSIRLNVKALGQGRFQCGHFDLKLDESSADKIVWSDMRTKGKVSVWDQKKTDTHRDRSRSRSSSRRQPKCGCVLMGKVMLRCNEHQPLLPPRSVLHDISTPGAWAPPVIPAEAPVAPCKAPPALWIGASQSSLPTAADTALFDISSKIEELAKAPPGTSPEIAEKLSEVDRLFEAYDESLTQVATAAELPQPLALLSSDALQQVKAMLLVKHSQAPAANFWGEPKEQQQVKLGEAKAQIMVKHFKTSGSPPRGSPKDPRLRRTPSKVTAPTGGA